MGDEGREGSTADPNKIVAVCLLTKEELRNVGTGLKRLYPLPADHDFDALLRALGKAVAKRS